MDSVVESAVWPVT